MHSWQFVFPFWLTALFNGICYWWKKHSYNVWWVLLFAMVMESCIGNFPLKLLVFYLFLMMIDCLPSRGGLWPRLLKPWPKGQYKWMCLNRYLTIYICFVFLCLFFVFSIFFFCLLIYCVILQVILFSWEFA